MRNLRDQNVDHSFLQVLLDYRAGYLLEERSKVNKLSNRGSSKTSGLLNGNDVELVLLSIVNNSIVPQ
jgi:hypothetical protein